MRFRYVYTVLGSILVLFLWTISDPDLGLVKSLPIGGGTLAMLLFMTKGVIASTLLLICRKAFHDYSVADFEELGRKATRDSQGAGMYSISIAINTLAYAVVIGAAFLS